MTSNANKKDKDDDVIGKDVNEEELEDQEEDKEDSTNNFVVDQFDKFFRSFKIKKNNQYPYVDQVQAIFIREEPIILVNYIDLPEELSNRIFRSDTDSDLENTLELMRDAIKSLVYEFHPGVDPQLVDKIIVRISIDDSHMITPLQDIDVDIRNKFIVFDCTIVSTSEVKSALKRKKFVCKNFECQRIYDRKKRVCQNQKCKSKKVEFSLRHSKLTSYQVIEVQERQDDRKTTNSLPITLVVKLYGDLVNKFRAGDNVRITGITKLEKTSSTIDKKINEEQNPEFSEDILFNTVIEAHNIQLLSTSQDSVIKDPFKILTKEDIKAIERFIQKHPEENKRCNILYNSFADYVYGYEDVKEFLCYQIVGSVTVELPNFSNKRKDIHGLLVGDPGTTKSSLIQEAAKISIHGIYTSGKGSSGVGLTASIDNDSKGMNKLKVGAAVLADKGLCAVDEFLSISEDDREYLLESMEHGTFHVNKGGINAILNTRTSFVMATNSTKGKYDRFLSLKENVPMTDQLFSRFDFIYVLRDIPNRELDDKIADHILNIYDPSYNPESLKENKSKLRVSRDFLFKYLVYAKTHNLEDIKFTREAIENIKRFYHEIRHPVKETDVTATPRQLEGLIRISIARARFNLRDTVTGDDSLAIIKLLTRAFQSTGMMPEGSVSAGLNMTNQYAAPLHKMSKVAAFQAVFDRLTEGGKEPCEKEDVVLELNKKARWEMSEAYLFWDKMMKDGKILTPIPNRYLYDLDQ